MFDHDWMINADWKYSHLKKLDTLKKKEERFIVPMLLLSLHSPAISGLNQKKPPHNYLLMGYWRSLFQEVSKAKLNILKLHFC